MQLWHSQPEGKLANTSMQRTALRDAADARRYALEETMDSFEKLVGSLFEKDGYWVRTSVKVELTAKEKRKIGRPSSPRWELDVVAYKGKSNELLVVECKSFLDSHGVRACSLDGTDAKKEKHYKLFNDNVLRKTVFGRLKKQLVSTGYCASSPSVKLCLVAGKVASETDRGKIKNLLERKGWGFFDDNWLKDKLLAVSNSGYENEIASVVAKILLREKPRHNHHL
jgi:hypothetical protein